MELIKWNSPFQEKIDFVVRTVLGGLFAYAGVGKIMSVRAFAKTIAQYNLVPEQFLIAVAIVLPILEIAAGIGLIFTIRFSLTMITGMLVIFTGVLWYGILNNLEIDCGCFSTEELAVHDSLRQAFYRDIAMLVSAAYLYASRLRRHGLKLSKIL